METDESARSLFPEKPGAEGSVQIPLDALKYRDFPKALVAFRLHIEEVYPQTTFWSTETDKQLRLHWGLHIPGEALEK